MTAKRAVQTDALLVRSASFGEAHRMLTLLTADLGKVTAMAPGARRSRRRFPPGTLQPFQILRAVLTPQRRGDLLILSEAEVLREFPSIALDPPRYACASYVVELIRDLTAANETDAAPLRLLEEHLAALEAQGFRVALLASFLLRGLEQGGLAPCLDRCASCGRPAPAGAAGRFDVTRGVVCSSCGGEAPVIRGRVRQELIGLARGEVAGGCSDIDLVPGIGFLLRFVHHQLGHELKSEVLLRRALPSELPES